MQQLCTVGMHMLHRHVFCDLCTHIGKPSKSQRFFVLQLHCGSVCRYMYMHHTSFFVLPVCNCLCVVKFRDRLCRHDQYTRWVLRSILTTPAFRPLPELGLLLPDLFPPFPPPPNIKFFAHAWKGYGAKNRLRQD